MADIEKLTPIKTAHGMLQIYRDWECEGAIYMKNAKTIKRYKEIQDDHPDSEKYGIFWAFSEEQYAEGRAKLIADGFIKKDDKIYSIGGGGYGASKELIDEFFNYYANRRKKVAVECDPQEVYLYEYNNHECMIDWDGDIAAYNIIVETYGKEVAESITRFSVKC